MKRSTCLVFAGVFASSLLSSMTYYVLEMRGGSHIYATDAPVRKGRLTLFHRYPDGVYISVASSELVKVETAQEPPPQQAEKFAPGDVRYIGGLRRPRPAGAGACGRSGHERGIRATRRAGTSTTGTGTGTAGAATCRLVRPSPPPARSNIGPTAFRSSPRRARPARCLRRSGRTDIPFLLRSRPWWLPVALKGNAESEGRLIVSRPIRRFP